MRIFKTKWFIRFARKKDITDKSLYDLVNEIMKGCYDADLGGNIYKQRLVSQSKGKSGGFRIILCLRKGERTFIVYGFSKTEQGNISSEELIAFKKMAIHLFDLTDIQVNQLLQKGELKEIQVEEFL